ncbi:MAG: NADPH-dependent glutamate synthase [Prevotellaceae bacterium]|jgi:glutamate synthase (NADPH/NADH) small chain|nr:NADPH-dependent glutamate synthase [Prevotellaceae bacterium]
MANRIGRVEAREQEAQTRRMNFKEVSLGYTNEEAVLEASRCLQCRKPRCVPACPVNVQIPAFIAATAQGRFAEAAHIIATDSCLPAVCGRVCPQETQCEGACILGLKGQAVNIGKLERFVGDYSREQGEALPVAGAAANERAAAKNRQVAVVGSGPAGLSCAHDLAKGGCAVTIFEALHKAGGVLEYGIPEFRLPKDTVVKKEIENLKKLGVKIETNVIIGRTLTIDALFEEEGFEAVFIASGAGLPKFMNIAGENLNGVVSANEFLTRSNLMRAYDKASDTPIYTGRRVAVVGGGNVAMDAARTALRLGAETSIVYRRTERELPARAEEVKHAKEEGISFYMLTNPVAVLGDARGWVRGLRCVRMELGEVDASGRRSPVAVANSEFEMEAEMVIMALGTSPNPLIASTTEGLVIDRRCCIVTDEEGATSRKGVFAGGDIVSGAATVILAMGAGRRAAAGILRFLEEKAAGIL